MIRSTKGDFAESLCAGRKPKRFSADLVGKAQNKLAMVNAAAKLDDLRSPPGNKLEALKADRKGQHSIRINDQWRVCFRWKDGDAFDVEICDYH